MTDAFHYGVDVPHGVAAVEYAYSAEGMWRDLTGLTYGPNYYPDHKYLTPRPAVLRSAPPHRPDRAALIRLARAPGARYTARDANGHLLDGPAGGFAFHEHNGRGAGGVRIDQPFHQFWYDDNWLARIMARTYGRPEPDGLTDHGDHVRWRILTGDPNWTPHDRAVLPGLAGAPDRLALDGLYHLATGRPAVAVRKWRRIVARAGRTWGEATRFTENYHLGLAKVLAEQLLAHGAGDRDELIQHSAALRAAIVARQQPRAGWTSGVRPEPPTLMNIETLAVNVLALGAGALRTYAPDAGPDPLGPGAWIAEFVVRGAPTTLTVADSASRVLGERRTGPADRFDRVAVPFVVPAGGAPVRFRGGADLAEIRLVTHSVM